MNYLLLSICAITFSACSTYSDTVKSANYHAEFGRTERAIEGFNKQLGVKKSSQLPKTLKGNHTLLLLERATLLQAIGDYERSARDMVLVDQHMAWIDVQKSNKQTLGNYLYSGKGGLYRSPPFERLMLNVLNMTNFLAIGNFSAAKVEARRFEILEQFFSGEQKLSPSILSVGHYLSAVAYEGGRDYASAARSYGRAYHFGIKNSGLEDRIIDLVRVTGRSEREFDASLSGLDTLLVRARDLGPMTSSEYRVKHLTGDVVVIVQTGLAPMKRPESIPIEQAKSMAGTPIQANGVNAINFPSIDNARRGTVDATLEFGQGSIVLDSTADVSKEVMRSYYSATPALMTAAISRAATRSVAGKGTEGAVVAISHDPSTKVLGWLAATAVKGGLNANDRPDTRSWTTLPANITVRRIKLESGNQIVAVASRQKREERVLEIGDALRPQLINFSRNR